MAIAGVEADINTAFNIFLYVVKMKDLANS